MNSRSLNFDKEKMIQQLQMDLNEKNDQVKDLKSQVKKANQEQDRLDQDYKQQIQHL